MIPRGDEHEGTTESPGWIQARDRKRAEEFYWHYHWCQTCYEQTGVVRPMGSFSLNHGDGTTSPPTCPVCRGTQIGVPVQGGPR